MRTNKAVERRTLPDGLTALREEMKLAEIMRLIEHTAQ